MRNGANTGHTFHVLTRQSDERGKKTQTFIYETRKHKSQVFFLFFFEINDCVFPEIHSDALRDDFQESNETKIHSSELTFVGWQPCHPFVR